MKVTPYSAIVNGISAHPIDNKFRIAKADSRMFTNLLIKNKLIAR